MACGGHDARQRGRRSSRAARRSDLALRAAASARWRRWTRWLGRRQQHTGGGRMTLQTPVTKATDLDLSDIQGNVVRGYARFGFPFGRYIVYRVQKDQGACGRSFLRGLLPLVTTAAQRSLVGAAHAKMRPD